MRQTEGHQEESAVVMSSSTKTQFGRLVEACKRKDLAGLRNILETKPRLLSYHDKRHRNLLHYAVILVQEEEQEGGTQTGGKLEASDRNASEAEADERAAQCLACFAYLLDRSRHLEQLDKLWNQADLDGLTILHLAVISCNVPLVRAILSSRPAEERMDARSLVTRLDKERHSPLHWAVITNSLASVKLLLDHSGVQLAHQPDLNGATPLHYATQTCDYPKYRQQLRQMLKNAASVPNKQSPSGGRQQSSESAAKAASDFRKQESVASLGAPESTTDRRECDLDILLHLSQLSGINLECLDGDARTPLLWAASSGNRRAIQILVQAGADALCRDSNRLGAVHCAASHGFIDCLELLLQLSADQQLDQADNLSCTPLFYAVLSGNIECVELLLDRGAAPDWQDVKGRTATHFAALKGQLNTLKLLEARRADLWLANKQGDLPLHYAIKSGRQQVVGWLLERSPYERAVNAINNAGRAPIHLAIAKQNAQMVDFLIRRGANLDQLVKVRDKTVPADNQVNVLVNGSDTRSGYRYETALDMAHRLAAGRCLELLEAASAQSAAQVLASRQTTHGDKPRSLFDLQAAEAASPIGFETSASSAEPQSEQLTLSQPIATPVVAQLPGRPAPLKGNSRLADQSDSTGSSALSQSSLTSLRGLPPAASKRATQSTSQRQETSGQRSQAARVGPMRGGIDYQNDFMNASIKCKLYNNHSFPPLETGAECGRLQQQQHRGQRHQSTSSLPQPAQRAASTRTGPQQEIVARVNVFASPIQHHCATPVECRKRQQQLAAASQMAAECLSDTPTSSTDSQASNSEQLNLAESDDEARFLPEAGIEQQSHKLQQREPGRFMLPSQGYTQHLPVILSAEEERSTSGETVAGADESRHYNAGLFEKPRLGRAHEGGAANTRRLGERYRDQVTSPVADYIHQQRSPTERRQPRTMQQQQQEQVQRLDYSQVKAKVDSHRNDSGLSSHFGDDYDAQSAAGRRSKSWSSSSASGQQTVLSGGRPAHHSQAPLSPARAHKNHSPERRANDKPAEQRPTRTIIKTRRLSVDTNELASRVEKSIRKYKQETKLFEELQNLKRSQIRSGRANEALLVKRLIEQFKADAHQDASLIGLETYRGPFTYKAYELYLYDQLRKLSQSNDAKLVGAHLPHKFTAATAETSAREADRDYLEEDLNAELELQRVINRTDQDAIKSYLGGQAERIAIEASGALEEIRVADGLAQGMATKQLAQQESIGRRLADQEDLEEHLSSSSSLPLEEPHDKLSAQELSGLNSQAISSASSSRRSSVDVERERLDQLPLRVGSVSESKWQRAADADDEAAGEQEQELKQQLGALVDERERGEIAAEANELTAAIITDALGNLSRRGSRAGSPVGIRKRASEVEAHVEQPTEAGDSAAQNATSAPAGVEADGKSERGLQSNEGREEGMEAPKTAPKRGITRRRSVVNIGNKMEVVEHFVGIAIEPVAEGNRISDDEAESQSHTDAQAQVAEASPSGAELRESGEEQLLEEAEQERDSEKQSIEDMEHKSALEPTHEAGAGSQLPANHAQEQEECERTESEDDGRAEVSSIARGSIICSEPLRVDNSRPTAVLTSLSKPSGGARRASSPPVPGGGSATGAVGASSARRHASISEKVFAGFELDSMHSARRSKRDRLSRGQSLVQQQQQREEHSAGEVGGKESSPSSRPKKTFERRQRRLQRSRLPRAPYVVEIPIGLVRERWCAIKRRERRRLRQQLAHNRQGNSIEMLRERRRQSSQGVAGLRESRTQPNLQEKGSQSLEQDALSTANPTTDCSNFTLIYELNKDSIRLTTARHHESQAAKQAIEQRWCQARVSRIVDVRTLKRTLSLPESLLYSNDLLKRFNILKL